MSHLAMNGSGMGRDAGSGIGKPLISAAGLRRWGWMASRSLRRVESAAGVAIEVRIVFCDRWTRRRQRRSVKRGRHRARTLTRVYVARDRQRDAELLVVAAGRVLHDGPASGINEIQVLVLVMGGTAA